MIDANQWLEGNYPQNGVCLINKQSEWEGCYNNYGKQRSVITHLELEEKNLIGVLDLTDFVNLQYLSCYNNGLAKLLLPNSSQLLKLYCHTNQLTSIILPSYPLIKVLECSENQLSSLELNHCLKLKTLDCSNNQLVSLNLSNNIELVALFCTFNKLTKLSWAENNQLKIISPNDCLLNSFNYENLNPNTLTRLFISNNSLPITDIAVFSHLINLELLWIGNWNEDSEGLGSYSERIKDNIYNRFFGSLASWKNLTKLKAIEISNTDINDGLEYLPSSVETMFYSTKERPHCQLKEIEQKITEWLEKKQLTNEIEITQLEEIVEDSEINH